MTAFLWARQIRIFDYPRFAEPLRDRVRERAAELAAAAGITIEHIASSHIRKEEVVAKVLATRGDHPGLVHVISAMEACPTYKPWHSKQTHRTFLRPATGKCLHYYFYFIDAEVGLIYLRVPTPAFAGAGSGVYSACSSIATNTAGWPENSPPPGSASRLPTTPLCASMIGHGRRPSISSRPRRCITSSIAAPVLGRPKAGPVGPAVLSVCDLFAQSYHWTHYYSNSGLTNLLIDANTSIVSH